MAYLVTGGDDAFDAMLYGDHHAGTIAYLDEQRSRVRNYLTDTGMRFRERAEAVVQRFNYSDAMRLTRAVNRAMTNAFKPNNVRRLENIGQIQQAKTEMQRWIMAEPTIRAAYHAQRCDGYSETYVDDQPKAIGSNHYDYRRATNGVFFGRNNKEPLAAVTYFETAKPNDVELSFDDQVNIINTWDLTRRLLLEGKEDPTSVFNAML